MSTTQMSYANADRCQGTVRYTSTTHPQRRRAYCLQFLAAKSIATPKKLLTEVLKYSPPLAARLAAKSVSGMAKVVDDLEVAQSLGQGRL